ncbi:serine protease [Aphanomyces cochlioides]|nr:serine protease [Aphanomyces cochlioides]
MTATPNLATGAAAASALAASAEVALAYKQKKSTRHSLNELDAERLEAWEESIEVLRESLLYEDTNALQWEKSLEEALGAIVSIRIMQVVSFDGDAPSCTVATGFIVGKERGLILTNRHVVKPGPGLAKYKKIFIFFHTFSFSKNEIPNYRRICIAEFVEKFLECILVGFDVNELFNLVMTETIA